MRVLLILVRLRIRRSFSQSCFWSFLQEEQYFCQSSRNQVVRVRRIWWSFGGREFKQSAQESYYSGDQGSWMDGQFYDIAMFCNFYQYSRNLLITNLTYSHYLLYKITKFPITTHTMHNNTYLLSQVQSIFHHGPSFHSSPAIKCTNSASFSCILTMAEYLCESMPDLAPPLFPPEQKQADQGLTLQERKRKKLYFQPWCDYFNGLMEGGGYGEILEDKGVMYLICEVDEEYYGQIKEYLGDKFESISKETVQKLIQQSKNSLPQQKRLHVGIINFATSQLKNDPFTPKVNLLSLFTGIWFRHGDSWRRYDVLKGNYPTEENLEKMDIFILSGSTYSVNDQNQHVEKTMALIKQGLKTNKKLKVLGLCFGHQAIAKYFGGSVERRDLYSGIEVIKFNSQQTKKFPHLQTLNQLNTQGYLIFQFHNDYVTAIPQNFHNLAHSKSCENEALISQDGRCMTFQFHNEYTYGYIQDFEVRIKNYFKQDLYKTDYKLRLEALEEFGVDRHIESCRVVRELVRKFMEWKVEA